MNERIKQLAEQAGLKWKAQPPHYTNTNNPIDFPVSANRDLEKFAELIVKECTKLIEQSIEDDEYWSRATGAESIMAIEDHFGVEQ
jgi:hypothetical protein